METALYTLLTTTAGVYSLVGGTGAAARVYPLIRPQGAALPAVTFQRIDTQRLATTSLSGHNSKIRCRMQIDCWATTYAAAQSLFDAVKAAMLSATAFSALNAGEHPLYEDDTKIYRVTSDWSCWFTDT